MDNFNAKNRSSVHVSKSILLADFKRKHILLWFKKSETRKFESIHEQHFVERKMRVEKTRQKLEFDKTRVYDQRWNS